MPARVRNPEETRDRLIQAAVKLILRQGFPATTVDEICAEAKLTKGSFFHHFPSKDALGMAVVTWWSDMGNALYAPAWDDTESDPLDALHRFLEIMNGFTEGEDPCTCVLGMISQEMALSHPGFRERCEESLSFWTDSSARLIAAAKAKHAPESDIDPHQVAWFLNSLWQGSMLVAKTRNEPEMIRNNLRQARVWLDSLFLKTPTSKKP
ncbi:MAG: TetR/AcrR family transcriptional regulator [Luteolibacter sp.]